MQRRHSGAAAPGNIDTLSLNQRLSTILPITAATSTLKNAPVTGDNSGKTVFDCRLIVGVYEHNRLTILNNFLLEFYRKRLFLIAPYITNFIFLLRKTYEPKFAFFLYVRSWW